MSDARIAPCLWFDDQAEEAARFYTQTFPEGRIRGLAKFPESFDNPSGKPPGSVMTVDFEVAGQRFTALNGGPHFTINPSISFFAFNDSAEETDRLYAALAEGGEALMPLDDYPWSERYGWVKDRFGVSWQVMTGHRRQEGSVIAPCLMFAGEEHGRAEEAIQTYIGLFPQSGVHSIARYGAEEGPEGTVKHGRFVLAGQDLVAMDSHIDHGFTFNEAVSLQVMCKDQAEVDHYWEALSEEGQEGPCGWLKDRFGVSWQVVPTAAAQWMTSDDAAAGEAAFQAMLKMKKIDIAAVQSAFENPPG
ncbi:MAG TPA: VOC family protein [Acidobacteriota bacterium]|nr:VOC family protein [Acidobacteriota bacterium]